MAKNLQKLNLVTCRKVAYLLRLSHMLTTRF